MALEELPAVAYRAHAPGSLAINIYGPGEATLKIANAGLVGLVQSTRYPFDGSIRIVVNPEVQASFSIRLRIPTWAGGAVIKVNGIRWQGNAEPGTYAVIERSWQSGDALDLVFPMAAAIQRKSSRSVQESKDPYGEAVKQEVMRYDYLAITRGPLVYHGLDRWLQDAGNNTP